MLRKILHELKHHRFFLPCPTKIINVLEERVKYWLTETGKKEWVILERGWAGTTGERISSAPEDHRAAVVAKNS